MIARTVEQWLSELNPPQYLEAIEELFRQEQESAERVRKVLQQRAVTFCGAMALAFNWERSELGNLYWEAVVLSVQRRLNTHNPPNC